MEHGDGDLICVFKRPSSFMDLDGGQLVSFLVVKGRRL